MSKAGLARGGQVRRCKMCPYESNTLDKEHTLGQQQCVRSSYGLQVPYDSFTFSAFMNFLFKTKSLCLSQSECCAIKRIMQTVGDTQTTPATLPVSWVIMLCSYDPVVKIGACLAKLNVLCLGEGNPAPSRDMRPSERLKSLAEMETQRFLILWQSELKQMSVR